MALRLGKITKQFTTAITNLNKFIDQEEKLVGVIRADMAQQQLSVDAKVAEIDKAARMKGKLEELLS